MRIPPSMTRISLDWMLSTACAGAGGLSSIASANRTNLMWHLAERIIIISVPYPTRELWSRYRVDIAIWRSKRWPREPAAITNLRPILDGAPIGGPMAIRNLIVLTAVRAFLRTRRQSTPPSLASRHRFKESSVCPERCLPELPRSEGDASPRRPPAVRASSARGRPAAPRCSGWSRPGRRRPRRRRGAR